MRIALRVFLAVFSANAVLPLCAVDGTVLGTSDASPAFAVYSVDGATYAAMSQAEIVALPPLFSRSGETVTATSPSGGVVTLSSSSLASVLDAGGVWTIANSVQGTAHVGVAWAVYADGGALAEGVSGAYTVESMSPGPDRKVKKREAPPVAYSGDDWLGNPSAASTLGFVSPSGDGTNMNLVGCGAQQFTFNKAGQWMVRLTAGGKVREAEVTIINGGFGLSIR